MNTLYVCATGLFDDNGVTRATGRYWALDDNSVIIQSGDITTTDQVTYDSSPGTVMSVLFSAAMSLTGNYDVNTMNISATI